MRTHPSTTAAHASSSSSSSSSSPRAASSPRSSSPSLCAGDNFYLIRSGEVKCTKVGSADEVSRRLKKGDFFGELALLSTDKRAATVSSVEKTTVLTLGRVQFTRLLGPLKDIMAAADQGRK